MNHNSKKVTFNKILFFKKRAIVLTFLLIFIIQFSFSQREELEMPIDQADSRIQVRIFYDRANTLFGAFSQDFRVTIQNNTQDKLLVQLEYWAELTCGKRLNNFIGPFKEGLTIKPGELVGKRWGSDGSNTATRIFDGTCDKSALKKVGTTSSGSAEYSAIRSLSYRLISIENISEKERQEKAEKERIEKERVEKEKAEKEKKEKEEKAKQEQVEKERIAKEKAEQGKANQTNLQNGSSSSPSKVQSSDPSSDSSSSQNKETYEESQAKALQAARNQEEARLKAEEEARQQRQSDYEAWREQKQEQINTSAAASAGASMGVLFMLGGFIYEGMGNVNPDNVYRKDKNINYYVGANLGFTGSIIPHIFQSSITSMYGGEYETTKSLMPKSAYLINLDGVAKIGAETNYLGGYAFYKLRAGFSPVFDAFQYSLLNIGGHIAGGLPNFKVYGEIELGGRNLSTSSLNAEEAGTGVQEIRYRRTTYGLKYTTNPDQDYVRSHFLLGIINENIKPKFEIEKNDYGYYDGELKHVFPLPFSKTVMGYTFHYIKDHNFDFFINIFPKYHSAGKIKENRNAPMSSDFSEDSLFFEVGFIRNFDFWF